MSQFLKEHIVAIVIWISASIFAAGGAYMMIHSNSDNIIDLSKSITKVDDSNREDHRKLFDSVVEIKTKLDWLVDAEKSKTNYAVSEDGFFESFNTADSCVAEKN